MQTEVSALDSLGLTLTTDEQSNLGELSSRRKSTGVAIIVLGFFNSFLEPVAETFTDMFNQGTHCFDIGG